MALDWNQMIIYVINCAVRIILTVLIPYAFAMLGKYIKTDIQRKYLIMAEDIIHDAVVQVQQTYVDDLKAENLFDHDAQVTAYNKCRDAVLYSMSAKMQNVIKEAVGDFETFLKNKIEAEVYYNKDGNTGLLDAVEEA